MDILGEALKQGIMPAIVVVIYLLIVKIIDNKKNNIQIRLNSELVNSIANISKFINTITKNTIEKDKEKCKIAIEDSFSSTSYSLTKFVIETLINNHIDINKESILSNVKNIANAEFYNIYATLNLYEINDVKVSEYLDKGWIEEIESAIVNSIYTTSNFSIEDKIFNFSNKIHLKFQSYNNYIINNVIKN